MTGNTSTSQACAACKYQRRKCSPECPLAPYFPPDQPKQFLNVHRLYGVSNTLRILKQVDPSKKNDAMKSIVYEADAWEKDPVHGCFGVISFLQSQVEMLREELQFVRNQLHILQQQQIAYFNQQQLQSLTCGVSNMTNSAPWMHHQYMPTFPHMGGAAEVGTGLLKPATETKPSFDMGLDYNQLHTYHEVAKEIYESSAESSLKDAHSLEHDELESAAALFTLTAGQHG